ncbi:MAG: hypothetical protein ACLQBA_04405 [Candidatus Binataceae bacterium]
MIESGRQPDSLMSIKEGGVMKEFASEIYAAVHSGKLAEPFNAAMVKLACPGWADRTYHVFLSKHAVGNGATTELFKRVAPGFYKLTTSK